MLRFNPRYSALGLLSALAVIVAGGCDWPSAPEGMDEEVIVLRGPDGYHEMVGNNAFWVDISTAASRGVESSIISRTSGLGPIFGANTLGLASWVGWMARKPSPAIWV